MHFYLYIPKELKELKVSNSTTLGRTKGDHLFPNNMQISSLHCQITVKDNTVFIKDLNSRNGTFVNGKKIPTNVLYELADESEITIGGLILVLKVKGSATSYQTGLSPSPRNITTMELSSKDEAAPLYAGFMIRLAARILDVAFITLIASILMTVIGLFFKSNMLYLLPIVLCFIYEGYFLSGKWKATPGKVLFGLEVYKNETESMSLLMAILRYIIMSLSCYLIFGIFWIVLNRKKRGLHDFVACTSVRKVSLVSPVGRLILFLMIGPLIVAIVVALLSDFLGTQSLAFKFISFFMLVPLILITVLGLSSGYFGISESNPKINKTHP